jgi:hypothetical protein
MVGVGLPHWPDNPGENQQDYKKSRENIMAWPGASVPISKVLEIHGEANRRSNLFGYEQIRHEFFRIIKGHANTPLAESNFIIKLFGQCKKAK